MRGAGTGVGQRLHQQVSHSVPCGRNDHDRPAFVEDAPHVPGDPGRVFERSPSEFDDHRSAPALHRADFLTDGIRPSSSASSAFSTEAPAPPRTALWARRKNRR